MRGALAVVVHASRLVACVAKVTYHPKPTRNKRRLIRFRQGLH